MNTCEICLKEIRPGEGFHTSMGEIHKNSCPSEAERSGAPQAGLPSATGSADARASDEDGADSSVVRQTEAVRSGVEHEAAFYRDLLNQITQDSRKTRARRLAESGLIFWDTMKQEASKRKAASQTDAQRSAERAGLPNS